MKQFIIFDENENSEKERDHLLEIWNEGRNENGFLEELRRLADYNLWKESKIDIIIWYQVFNIIDEILEKSIQKKKNFMSLNGKSQEEENLDQQVQILLMFLKTALGRATNANYFNSSDVPFNHLIHSQRIIEIFSIYKEKNEIALYEEIFGVLITLANRQNEKKSSEKSGEKRGLERFNDIMNPHFKSIMGIISCFDTIAELLIKCGSENQNYVDTLRDKVVQMQNRNSPDEADFLQQLQQFNIFIKDQQAAEHVLTIILKAISLYLYTGDPNIIDSKYEQTTKLETLFHPKLFIEKLIKLLKSYHLGKKIHNQVISLYFLFTILDLSQIFFYSQPMENRYYAEACTYHDFYINTLQQFTRYHAYDKIKTMLQSESSLEPEVQEIEKMLEKQRTLIVEEEGGHNINQDVEMAANDQNQSIKSQKYFNSFLNFLCHLLNIKNRTLSTQLYPQFLKPLLAIIYVKPYKNQYLININVQLKAAKLLKDVVKMSSLDDPGAVENVLERLKEELQYLHQLERNWEKFEDDDCENNIVQLHRLDLIRTFLRFLSYSIIRNDPSKPFTYHQLNLDQINFTHNFIANSRKILDSNLIQGEIMEYLFLPNMKMDAAYLAKTTDQIMLQCIQMVSYIFNDLPQKIPQFIENGVIPQIIESLSVRIPIQPDFLVLIMKFIQTLCLNKESADLVAKSQLLYTFAALATNHKTHKQIVNQNKAPLYKDLLQQIGLNNKDVAATFYKAIVVCYKGLVEQAWDVTENYVKMENILRDDGDKMSESQKNELKFQYERKQIALDFAFESTSNMLWYFAIDEGQNRNGNFINDAIAENKELVDIFIQVITTPIVASACPNMFPSFIEIFLQVLLTISEEFKLKTVDMIFDYIEAQIDNLHKVLKGNIDDIHDLEQSLQQVQGLKLDETNQIPERQGMIDQLKAEDQVSVVFGKIAFYSEMIFKCQPQTKQKVYQHDKFNETVTKLFTIHSLINRYHAFKYQQDIQKEINRLNELRDKYADVIKNTDFAKFTVIKEPVSEEEEVKNLYLKHEFEKFKTVTEFKATDNYKTTIELQLEENISHTSNQCQMAIRKLVSLYLKYTNKKKIYFRDEVDIKVLNFNKLIGYLIAQEFKEFTNMPNQNEVSDLQVMKLCCQFSAIFDEFNKILFGGVSYGTLLIEFVNNDGVEHVQELVLWIVKYLYTVEQSKREVSVNLCKNIQLLWSHIINFFVTLVDPKYIDMQFQQFLIAFKPDPLQSYKQLPEEQYTQIFEKSMTAMKTYFFNLFTKTLRFLFIKLNENKYIRNFFPQKGTTSVFEYFDQISEVFFVSYLDLYNFCCKGLRHVKIFTQQYAPIKQDYKQAMVSEINVRRLIEMGFTEERAKYALETSRNDFEEALDKLMIPGIIPDNPPATTNSNLNREKSDSQPKQTVSQTPEETIPKFVQKKEIETYTKADLYEIIVLTIGDYLKFFPVKQKITAKSDILDGIIFKIGSQNESEITDLLLKVKQIILTTIMETHLNIGQPQTMKITGYLSYALNCLLCYKRASLLTAKEIFQSIFEIIALFQNGIGQLKEKLSVKGVIEPPNQKEIMDLVKAIDLCLQMFLYITEEGKTASDLNKLNNIVDTNTSSLQNNIDLVQQQLDEMKNKNQNNIFFKHHDQTAEIFQKVTLSIIDIFKSMHCLNPQLESIGDASYSELILRSLEILNYLMNIKGFGDYDCQTYFLQNEGLRALFGIKFIQNISSKSMFIANNEFRKFKEIQNQSKILLQMLCSNDQGQVRVYENLIKSILFIQFQEKYKKEEGRDLKSDINLELEQQLQSQHQSKDKNEKSLMGTQTNKKKHSQTPLKKIKTEEKIQAQQDSNILSSTAQKNQSKSHKANIYKKQEYGEVSLEDFILFFNNIMQVQDFKSFLLACQNICIIKKKKVSQINNKMEQLSKQEETKSGENQQQIPELQQKSASEPQPVDKQQEQPKRTLGTRQQRKSKRIASKSQSVQNQDIQEKEEYVIMLNHQSFKDMLQQLEQNLKGDTELTKEYHQKVHIQKFQQEIIFTLLDQFIEQIRDQQLVVLQSCKSKQNPSPLGIKMEIDQKDGVLKIKDQNERIAYQFYYFDIISILGHLTYLLNQTPILIKPIIKHKEGKTFKFITRNIYYLISMSITKLKQEEGQEGSMLPYDYQLNFETNCLNFSRKPELILEFFKKSIFENPHHTLIESKAKQEARMIFQKEMLKNLTDTSNNKYPQWPLLRQIYNISSLWLFQIVLKEEVPTERIQDKKLENIVQNMVKYRNNYRHRFIKSMIQECQQNQKGDQNQFALLKHIERIQQDIINNPFMKSYLKDYIQLCSLSLINLLAPFENNKNLWGDKEKAPNGSVLNESNLGFIAAHDGDHQSSVIDEDLQEDDDDEESSSSEEDEDGDDDAVGDDEDDMLDSDQSERNFRFSQHDEVDDYDDEDEEDEEMSDSFEEGEEPGSAGNEGDESYGAENEGEIRMIRDYLRDYGQEAAEDEDEDFEEGVDKEDENMDEEEEKDQQPVENNEPRPSNPNRDEAEGDEGNDENEDEYDDEAIEEDENESYDDEEDDYDDEDDIEEEMEIYIGREPDRESLMGQIPGIGGRGANGQRRDDILSINNLSLNYFPHFQMDQYPGEEINEDQDEQSFDYSQDNQNEMSQDSRRPQQRQHIHRGQHLNIVENILDHIEQINRNPSSSNINGRSPHNKKQSTHQTNESGEVAYKPYSALVDICTLSKDMQRNPLIYQLFIKEVQDPLQPQPGSNEAIMGQRGANERANENNTDQEQTSTKSQLSTTNLFKGKFNKPEGSLFGGPTQSNQQPAQTNPQVPATTNINTQGSIQRPFRGVLEPRSPEIELDPAFLEALDDKGLQNLQQTEEVMNFISHQRNDQQPSSVNLSSTQAFIDSLQGSDQRREVLGNMPQAALNQLAPPQLAEAIQIRRERNEPQPMPQGAFNPLSLFFQNIERQNRLAGQHRQGANVGFGRRPRVLSLDSQINDLTEFSRQNTDPYYRSTNAQGNNRLQNIIQDVQINKNMIFSNFSQYLQDLIIEIGNAAYDSKSIEIEKFCEGLIQQYLLGQRDEQTSLDSIYKRSLGFINMIVNQLQIVLPCHYIAENMDQRIMKMGILFKIPHIRIGILIKSFKFHLDYFNEYERKIQAFLKGDYEMNESRQPTIQVERGFGMNQKWQYKAFLYHCLNFYDKYIMNNPKRNIQCSLDLIKVPSDDHIMTHIIDLENEQQVDKIRTDLPILEQLMNQIKRIQGYSTQITEYNVLTSVDLREEDPIDQIFQEFKDIFTKLAQTSKLLKESQEQHTEVQSALKYFRISQNVISILGDIMLTREYKDKETQKDIRTIFQDLPQIGDTFETVNEFLKVCLSNSLQKFITIIEKSRISIDELKNEVIIITQVLKIAKSNAKQEQNICDENLFYRIVKEISFMIDRKHLESLNSSISQTAFMFKEEFRTVMIALFILFEYNLKFIFTDTDEIITSKRRSAGLASQRKSLQRPQNNIQVVMQDIQELKSEAVSVAPSKEKSANLMEAIEQHLQLKIKDQNARDDKRLKIFIKFCLEHKKIINSFIRTNQQVLNESLRNVLMKVPQILDFDNKRLLFRQQLKKIQKKFKEKYIDLQVRRDKVFDDSYEQLKGMPADKWKGQLNIEFIDEQGIDEGGLTKEWFILLSQEIFKLDLALFTQSNAGSTYYPNPQSVIQPEYIQMFKFVGRIVGKAVFEQQLLDCYFVKALYKVILGLPLTYHDIEDYDNEIYKNLVWVLNNPVEGLGFAFMECREDFGEKIEIELIEGGKDIDVTEENKYDYVQKMSYHKLYNSIKKQIDSFLSGFYDIVPKQLIQIFDNRELELLISGLPNIDIMDLKENTIYQSYTSESQVVKWLFEVLEEFDNSERAEFLQFVTGSSKVPVEGFKGLRGNRGFQKFQIAKIFTTDYNRLPQAHTCFKQLELPEYQSKDQLKDRLLTAIKEGKTFGFA